MRYFEEYKKLYYTSFCIHTQIKQFEHVKIDIENKINEIDVKNVY